MTDTDTEVVEEWFDLPPLPTYREFEERHVARKRRFVPPDERPEYARREVRVPRRIYRAAKGALYHRTLGESRIEHDERERARLIALAERIKGYEDMLADVQLLADQKRKLFIHDYRRGKPGDLLWTIQRQWQEAVAELLSFESALGLIDVTGNELARESWRRMRASLPDDVKLVVSPKACAAAQAARNVERRRPGPKPTGAMFDADDVLDVGALLTGRMLA